MKFNDQYPLDLEKVQVSKPVFHVPERSNFVFVRALQSLKGSDASNINDEEPAEDELEYSDDEAEAAAKRARKDRYAPQKLRGRLAYLRVDIVRVPLRHQGIRRLSPRCDATQTWPKMIHMADEIPTTIWTTVQDRHGPHLYPTTILILTTMGFPTKPPPCKRPRYLAKMTTTCPRAATIIQAEGEDGVATMHQGGEDETIMAVGEDAGVDVDVGIGAGVVAAEGMTDNRGQTMTGVSRITSLMTNTTPRSPARCPPLHWPSHVQQVNIRTVRL